jgi:hypothetical protein
MERGEDLIPAFNQAKSSVISKEFGPELKPQEIGGSIFTMLKYEGLSNDEVKTALKIYSELDVSGLSHQPNRIRRVGIYIGLLAFTYFVLSGINLIFVIPQTVSMYEAMATPLPENLKWFVDYWAAVLIVIMTLLTGALLISNKVKELFEYKKGVEDSMVYRFMLPKKIKSRYERLISLIHLPLYIVRNKNDGINDHIIEHYHTKEYSHNEISDSLSLIINENANHLLLQSESYLRRIYIIVAILILYSIFQFVSSIYAPIFAMGEVI